MVTVRTMRNAAALYVEDVYVHLHIKVLLYWCLGPQQTHLCFFFFFFFFFYNLNAKHLNLPHSTISSTSLFKMSPKCVGPFIKFLFFSSSAVRFNWNLSYFFFIVEKPGVCPSKTLIIGVCAEMCSHDSDCPNDEKCCSNGCGRQCTAPYRGINMAMCGFVFQMQWFVLWWGLFNRKTRSVSKQNSRSRSVCWDVFPWRWLSKRWEVLQQWMWTSVHSAIYRYVIRMHWSYFSPLQWVIQWSGFSVFV